MNLIIDIGNTSQKIALIENEQIVLTLRLSGFTAMEKFIGELEQPVNKAIISTVRDVPDSVKSMIQRVAGCLHHLTHNSSFPFSIDYQTPETLGMDRLAAIAGAYNKYADRNVLVIDAGTAITYDLLINGTYSGGAISPGVEIRFRALGNFTGRLPMVERNDDTDFPARSTSSGINCGVVNGIVYEINEYIRNFIKIYPDGLVIMTGGDSDYLAAKTATRMTVDPDLVIRGLNFILEYNAH
ncbi:MAG: type III pantothenate kinase [Bacteroidales bacterium]